jgi:glycosyltransferase involved in cell wall biosynthesis
MALSRLSGRKETNERLVAKRDSVKLVLAVDAVTWPLSGIGQYTRELALRLGHRSEIEALRLYRPGRWAGEGELLVERQQAVGHRPGRRAILRMPMWVRHWRRLRLVRDHLFHGPNYFLPPFSGPGIATVHDLSVFKFPDTHPEARRRQFEQEFFSSLRRASHLITDSEAIRREVIESLSWPAGRITAVPLGVSDRFAPQSWSEAPAVLRSAGLKANAYVLCVSTLEPRKGIGRLLQAYRGLPDSLRCRYPLVLAGNEGWLNDAILAAIGAAKQEGWLRHLGHVGEADVPPLYSGARAFVYPSVYEGFGLPVLEAMASGVPVLTSNCSSLPEVSGGAAFLVDPLDVDALRLGIERVIQDEPWRALARERGLQVAREHSWDRCVERTLAVYQKVDRSSGTA